MAEANSTVKIGSRKSEVSFNNYIIYVFNFCLSKFKNP